jgi:hypothetical protein
MVLLALSGRGRAVGSVDSVGPVGSSDCFFFDILLIGKIRKRGSQMITAILKG